MRDNTLRRILSALIDDFGFQEVRKSLDDFSVEGAKADAIRKLPVDARRKPKMRPNAIAVVKALKIDNVDKKDILFVLAQQYEDKDFMPNINSVRAFLAKQGKDISRVKSRQQAVSTVFKCLADWDTQHLSDLHAKGAFAGPKSLAVIADAIEKAGKQYRH